MNSVSFFSYLQIYFIFAVVESPGAIYPCIVYNTEKFEFEHCSIRILLHL